MGLGKNSIKLDPHRKKNLATVATTLKKIKNFIALGLHRKKYIYFCFRLQYYYGTSDLGKTQLALNPHRKKNHIFVSGYTITMMHRT